MLELVFNKVADLKTCNFIKKRLQHRGFPAKFCKVFNKSFFIEHLRGSAVIGGLQSPK